MADDARMRPLPKLPPYSVEAEQSVLGGMMLDNRVIDDVLEHVRPDEFYRQDHQLLCAEIFALHDRGEPTDFVTLSEHLRKAGKLDDVGGLAYLGTIANDTPSAANVLAYADIVRERATLRALIAAGGDIAQLGFVPDGRAINDLIELAEQQVYSIRDRASSRVAAVTSMSQIVTELHHVIDKASKGETPVTGLTTGLVDLDAMTTGLHPGDLVIVAGRPAMGKTSLAMGIAEYVSTRCLSDDGRLKASGVFSMEMPKDQLGMRMLASTAKIPLKALREGSLTPEHWNELPGAETILREAPIYIDDTGGLSPMELRARARRMKSKYGIQLLVVDYIQLMHVPGSENRTNEVSEISRSLKALAKELHLPIIALSQLNRGVENRENKRPRMADLRESGAIEQDADLILFVYRDEVYNENSPCKGTAEIIIGKQRNGPLGTARVAFVGEFTRFQNLAPGWEPITRDPGADRKKAAGGDGGLE